MMHERYSLIYADPPWQYSNPHPRASPDRYYSTMPLNDISALIIPAADDCILFLWATAPLLPEALSVLTAWGFKYRSCAVWDKVRPGVGYWFRGQHELLLVGVKGSAHPPAPTERMPSVFRCRRGRHSAKPLAIRDAISRWYPEARKLEMFARYKDELFPPEGWDVWGQEAGESRPALS